MDGRAAEIVATRLATSAELRARRAFRHVSQAETAQRSGLSKSTIERLERGGRDMDVSQLIALSRALNFDPAEYIKSVCTTLAARDARP